MSIVKKLIVLAGDIAALYLSLAVTLLIRYGAEALPESFATHRDPFSAIFLVWLLVLYLADLYRPATFRSNTGMAATLGIAATVATVVSFVLFYLFGDFFALTPKTNLLIFAVVFFVVDTLSRTLARSRFAVGAIAVAFLGDSPHLAAAASYILKTPHAGYRVAVWLRTLPGDLAGALRAAAREQGVQVLVLHPAVMGDPATLRTVYGLLPSGVGLVNFRDFYEMLFEKEPLEELDESWFIGNVSTRRPFYDPAKRVADIALALALGIIFLPFAVMAALAVLLSSHGPVIYTQERVGKNGRAFTLYKLRTMRHDAAGALWTEKNDTRVTPVGRFLRFTHLDEVPQLWNIFRGDISFIGPRPERKELVAQFARFPYYEMRHVVKPGLTGWAQINYRPSASFEEAFEKLRYDIYYVKNRSLFLDLMIVLRTVRYFFLSH